MKKRYIIIFSLCCLLIISGLFFYHYQQELSFSSKAQDQTSVITGDICSTMKSIYNRSLQGDVEVEYCKSNPGEYYLKIQRFGWEGGSGTDYYDLNGKNIGSIAQYGDGYGTIPEKPTISGKIYSNNDSCIKKNIQECGVIDLHSSYRGPGGLLKDSEYAKTCENTLEKLGLNPNYQSTELDSSRRDLSHRYFMCTDDTDIFYIGFTGNKIGNSRSASYQNFNTIEYFTMKGNSLGFTTGFQLKTNGDQLHGITINDEKAPYTIKRCIYIPTYDCYEE